MKIKTVILFFAFVSLTGCASLTARPSACELRHKDAWTILKYIFTSAEMVTMWGDCSLSNDLLRESGDYYRINKEKIDYEVQNSDKIKNGYPDNLFNFAKIYNCNDEGQKLFAKEVIMHKEDVFSKNYDKKPNEVMKAIQLIINNNQELTKLCSK